VGHLAHLLDPALPAVVGAFREQQQRVADVKARRELGDAGPSGPAARPDEAEGKRVTGQVDGRDDAQE